MKKNNVELELLPLTNTLFPLIGDKLKEFDCHDGVINKFLVEEAFEAQQEGIASTVLLVNKKNNYEIFGFFTLQLQSIDIRDEEEKIKDTFTAIRIALFAIDVKYQRKGIGQKLMTALKHQLISFNEFVGFKAIFLGAIVKYYKFYEKCGFQLFNQQEDEVDDKDQEVDMIMRLNSLYESLE